MTYSTPLDPKTNAVILIKLYKNVQNVKELRKKILNGELKCCILKPNLILDQFQIVVAANKALIAEKLTTKSIYTELLFNLSISKNITQSLQRFGIDDKENEAIVVVIKRKEETFDEMELFEQVIGEEDDLSNLSLYTDVELIKKSYKIGDIEYKRIPILDSVISRISTKDVLTI